MELLVSHSVCVCVWMLSISACDIVCTVCVQGFILWSGGGEHIHHPLNLCYTPLETYLRSIMYEDNSCLPPYFATSYLAVSYSLN